MKRTIHEKVANATFKIVCGNSSGSGFSLLDRKTIITNYHVIEINNGKEPIKLIAENGDSYIAEIVSCNKVHDFAVLKLKSDLPDYREVLYVNGMVRSFDRGRKVIYSGFPHGFDDLLVQEAIISGKYKDHGFYIDATVNKGNSGGPIVDAISGELIGIVTLRRFLGEGMLKELRVPMNQLVTHLEMNGTSFLSVGGVNFGEFARSVGVGLKTITEVLEDNANTGIGIGFDIKYSFDECNNPHPKNKYRIPHSIKRNAKCDCGSGKKFKHCCGNLKLEKN